MKKYLLALLLLCSSVLMAVTPEDNFKLAQEYYAKSDYTKAKSYYSKINNDKNYSDRIYENYRICFIKLREYKEADKFLKKKLKSDPDNAQYIVDYALNQQMMGNEKSFKSILDKEEISRKNNLLAMRDYITALVKRDLNNAAVNTMKQSKKYFNDDALFSYDLAIVELSRNNKKEFISHILVYTKASPDQLDYVENLLQSSLSLDQYELLENQLFPLLSDKSTTVYNELITWVYIQKKDFYNAFIQLRAIDKASYGRGKRLLELGNLATENKYFSTAIKIYGYIETTYPKDYNGYLAEKLKIGAKRQKIETTYPVDTLLIKSIVTDYKNLLTRTRRINDQVDIKRNMARIEAFYLSKYDQSINNLKSIVDNPRINLQLRSTCKLELGDIYILINQPWEAALLYYQVEKDFESGTIGHEAKLKNAKLSYYKGDFELAQSHLDILKEATTRKIANNAMALSLLIKDNLALDTSDAALKIYAYAEFFQFQGNLSRSIELLDSLIKTFPGHSLVDECYYKKGTILLSKGNYNEALEQFDKITQYHSTDILADDALFTSAYIYDVYLQNKHKAQELYRKVLIDYSGSVFVVESRKRYRLLRGDKI